ncbi:MAG: PAS domain-containing protein [Pseudomonadales bacterium]|nr:PAS domain-containing protein [Pseudomonadales bacterium]
MNQNPSQPLTNSSVGEQSETKRQKDNSPSHIVAIGASAGGLEALQALFDSMPFDLGLAYIVVQHLSPDYISLMDELLTKHTRMAIHLAEEGVALERDTIYLIPAGKLMRIAEGQIYLSDLPPDNRINMPINELFRSVAEDAQNRSIGIILSGTGSDGSRGLVQMKEMGAMIITQSPEEAQFDGMPLSAIDTGCVDFVLPVNQIPTHIQKYISHPLRRHRSNQFLHHFSENLELLESVLNLIREKTELDFKAYKESTVSRRIVHRMSINGKASLKDYHQFLLDNPEEIEQVKRDLLIGVTQFFRDHEVWDVLRADVVIPLVKSSTPGDPIRIWCVGCSTGEEAYTMALLFAECCETLGVTRHIKIFASDIDQAAVAFGATGIYPTTIATEVPVNLLSKYFIQQPDGHYQVTKELRSMVVFATHNIIQDPPFSNMHLVSCRNTLIYLQAQAQQKALAFFHFSLRLDGALLLGSAESPGNFNNYFDIIDSKLRIYRKTKDLRIPVTSIHTGGVRQHRYQPRAIPRYIEESAKIDARRRMPNTPIGQKVIFDHFVPPTMVVNHKLQLIYSYGDCSIFTAKLKPGLVTNDVADVLIPDIASQALSAAHQVIREKRSILLKNVYRCQLEGENTATLWSLKCFPIQEKDSVQTYTAISFLQESKTNTADIEYDIDQQAQQRISELDKALVECQRMYREVMEELDSTSEELQSSNEELMAANEELQSTNEELQSVNEELYTVNSEHQQKIAELTEANNDFENLLKTTRIAVLFLDSNLNIRRYTHALRQYVNIMDFDINRSFKDLSLKYEFDGLHAKIEKANTEAGSYSQLYVLDDNTEVEVSVTPYTIGQKHRGVVVSMRDLSQDE